VQKIIIVCFVVGYGVFSGTLLAWEQGQGGPVDRGQRQGPPRHPENAGHLLGKYLHDNMAADVLVTMTGQPAETIRARIKNEDMRIVLESFNVNHKKFRQFMDEKSLKVIEKAQQCGLITSSQAAEISSILKSHKNENGYEPQPGDP
jgi:hypothetical protein